jgi:hypothetical protein
MAKPAPPRQSDVLDAEGRERLERGLARAFQMPPKKQDIVRKQRPKKPKGGGTKPPPS